MEKNCNFVWLRKSYYMAMKYLFFGVTVISMMLSACSDNRSGSDAPAGIYPDDAVRIPYPDLPGMEKVTVYANGDILEEGDYLNGLKHGAWTVYNPDRRVVSRLETYYQGALQGTTLVFDRNGTIQSKTYYYNNQKHGQELIYDNRRVAEERVYENGVLNGMVKKYYRNGNLMEEAPYTNGVINGVASWYDQEGNLKFQYRYEMGELVDQDVSGSEE
jgi:hypothetical protein